MMQKKDHTQTTQAWHEAGINASHIEKIQEAGASEEAIQVVARWARSDRNDFEAASFAERLFDSADASSFTLKQWIEAIAHLHQWLEERERDVSLAQSMEYLDCCAEMANTGLVSQTLSEILDDMLQKFGFQED